MKNTILIKNNLADNQTKYKTFELFKIIQFKNMHTDGPFFESLNKYISSDINVLIAYIDRLYEIIYSSDSFINNMNFLQHEILDNIQCNEDNTNKLLIYGGSRKSRTCKNITNKCNKYVWKVSFLHSSYKKYTAR